jgi:hypothetical protein
VLWWTENIVMGCNALTMTVMPMDVLVSAAMPLFSANPNDSQQELLGTPTFIAAAEGHEEWIGVCRVMRDQQLVSEMGRNLLDK